MLNRRSLITGLISLVAAPAIVRVTSIMPIKALPSAEDLLKIRMNAAYELTRKQLADSLYGDLIDVTRQAFVPRLFVSVYRADPAIKYLDERWEP
jgi:hypothetical protein